VTAKSNISVKNVFLFWLPLAATWLMMAFEGPFLAAIIARLAAPEPNLAAFGVGYAIALFAEAPVIMLMTTSTAMVKNRPTYYKIRNFSFAVCLAVTGSLLLVIWNPVFSTLVIDWIALPLPIADLVWWALVVLIPWPAAIGYRRFYQGLLISNGRTRLVAYGTVLRLAGMSSTGLLLYKYSSLPGVLVAAAALSIGVIIEAAGSRIMAAKCIQEILHKSPDDDDPLDIDYTYIIHFYWPLAMTSALGMGLHPVVVFYLGQSKMAIASLAVLPVVNSLVFVFRSMGLAYQEVGIALMGKAKQGLPALKTFTILLGLGTIACLGIIAFTPLSAVWYQHISSLPAELARIAIVPTQILALLPGLSVLLSFQRAIVVQLHQTRLITIATALEVISVIVILQLLIRFTSFTGVTAAALSFVISRLLSNLFLVRPMFRFMRS